MISVLIPVYNTHVTTLVHSLLAQIGPLPSEIILLDDGSEEIYRQANSQLSAAQVRYLECKQNQGRWTTRKELSRHAKNPWLLFLDADSIIMHNNFLQNYYQLMPRSIDVAPGGRIYQSEAPGQPSTLHWRYGTLREKRKKGKKETNVYAGFMSNNFMIRKETFDRLQHPPSLTGYGHEDTWMGIQLEKISAVLEPVDNPVLHNGLEAADTFIRKTENAVRNLLVLEAAAGPETLARHVRLYRWYYRLRAWKAISLLRILYAAAGTWVLKNLRSQNPSLFLFDLYRLQLLVRLKSQNKDA